ncbi:adenylate/guanylate cyclase domain-containing protein, partial [Candidatus Riflebacteria bacterium]
RFNGKPEKRKVIFHQWYLHKKNKLLKWSKRPVESRRFIQGLLRYLAFLNIIKKLTLNFSWSQGLEAVKRILYGNSTLKRIEEFFNEKFTVNSLVGLSLVSKQLNFRKMGQVNYFFGKSFNLNANYKPMFLHPCNFKNRGLYEFYWKIIYHPPRPGETKDSRKIAGIYCCFISWVQFKEELLGELGIINYRKKNPEDSLYYFNIKKGLEASISKPVAKSFMQKVEKFIPELKGKKSSLIGDELFTFIPLYTVANKWSFSDWAIITSAERNFYETQQKNIVANHFLVSKKIIRAKRIEIQNHYYKQKSRVAVAILFSLILFLFLTFIPFVSIKTKLILFITIFIGIPFVLYYQQQWHEIKQSLPGKYRDKKEWMLKNLRQIIEDLKQENENLLALCRSLRDAVNYPELDEDQKNALRQKISSKGPFTFVLAYDSNIKRVFHYTHKKRKGIEAFARILEKLMLEFHPPAESETLKNIKLDATGSIITDLLGDRILAVIQQLDQVHPIQLGPKIITGYFDVVTNLEGKFSYLFFASLQEDNYINRILQSRANKSHLQNNVYDTRIYHYSPAFNLMNPDKLFIPDTGEYKSFPGSWIEKVREKCEEGGSDFLPYDFDNDFLVSYLYYEKLRRMLIAVSPKEPLRKKLVQEVKEMGQELLSYFAALLILVLYFSFRIITPINKLKEAMRAVESENYNFKLDINTKDEIEDLGKTFNHMLEGMAEKNKLAIAKAELKTAFSHFLSPDIVNEIEKDPTKLELGGKTSFVTAFFTDIQGFSSFSEILPPQQLVELLNEYLTEMTNILLEADGTLDKYEGDAIIAFFGAPIPNPDNPKDAMVVALKMQKCLSELRQKWKAEGDRWPEFVKAMRMRIGINSGNILTGNMGSKSRMNYTMMGDAVNLAARLEGAAKQYGIFIMVSEDTIKAYKDDFVYREVDLIRVVGRKEACRVYELLDFSENSHAWKNFLELYNTGLKEFRQANFRKAMDYFEMSEKIEANTKMSPSKKFFHRCQNILVHAEEVPEDQVFELFEK